jgi:NitT/TauT family transport system permease protein
MDSARTLNVNKATMILHILLPYSLPGIINSVTVSVSTSFLVLTAAEMIGATSGLGWYIKYHSDFANFTKVIFGIFMIGIVVTVLNVLIAAVRKVLIRWR